MISRIKILIVNVHSSLNAGDLALLQTTINLLRQQFPDAIFLVSANFPNEKAIQEVADRVVPSPWNLAGGGTGRKTRDLVRNLALGWMAAQSGVFCLDNSSNQSWKALFDVYQEVDMVVAVSGNQFFSSGRYGWPLFAIAMSVKLAGVFKKPVYIMPQSIGPLRSWWERILLRISYSNAQLVYLRDNQSLRLAREVKLPADKVKFVPDPAFTLNPVLREDILPILEKFGYQSGMRSIGVTIIAAMPSYLDQRLISNYYSSVAKALSEMAEKHNAHIFFFYQVIGPSSQEDDRVASEIVFRQMNCEKENIHLVKENLSPAQLKACYGCMNEFLASRLHSGIFSIGMKVPTVFIGYLSKTRGVLEALSMEQDLLELKDLTSDSLFALLESNWLENESQKAALSIRIAGIVEQISSAVRLIPENFKRLNG